MITTATVWLLRRRSLFIGMGALLLASGEATCPAQVVLDGKLGPGGPLAGPNYNITAGMGAVRGNNLFHSFSQFSLVPGDVATFSGPANIQNILSRVTGGSASSINGTIRSDIAGANFFFINPSGVIFGPNAVVDVSGSFAASTANYLKLADGAKFVAALDADDSGLSTAPVSAFGFLGNAPATLQVQQSALQVQDGKSVSLVGGDITLDGGSVKAAGGQINVVSVHSAGEVPVDPKSLSAAQFTSTFAEQGPILMQNAAQLDASGEGGGRIVIRGGSLVVDSSKINSDTTGALAGQGIDVSVVGDLNLVNGGQLTSLSTPGLGAGGDINVSAKNIRLDGGGVIDDTGYPSTQISTSTGDIFAGGGTAKGGDIKIQTEKLELVNSAQISSASFGAGDAGRLEITASSILMDAQFTSVVQLSANTQQIEGGGRAGDIVIHTGSLDMFNGATMFATTFGSGPAGLVDINAHSVNLHNGSIITVGTFGPGKGGDVHVTADVVSLDGKDIFSGGPDNLTGIQALSSDTGPGGTIQITAGTLLLDHMGSIFTTTIGSGPGGQIQVNAGNLSLANNSSITAATYASGSAGLININAQSINMLSGGIISASTFDAGSGGSIQIASKSLSINGQDTANKGPDIVTGIQATTASPDFSAPGGTIQIKTDSLTLDHMGSVSTTSSGSGAGGSIEVSTTSLSLANNSSISAAAQASGSAGVIGITAADSINLQSGGIITASTSASGNGGSIQVTAKTLNIDGKNGSPGGPDVLTGVQAITSSPDSPAAGGAIQIKTDSLTLDHSGSIATTSSGQGAGGNIDVTTVNLTLANNSSISAAAKSSGAAGFINVNGQAVNLYSGGIITASASGAGNGGDIQITAKSLTINGQSASSDGADVLTGVQAVTTSLDSPARGGTLHINTDSLELQHLGSLSTTSSGQGAGGNIDVTAANLILANNSSISAAAKSSGAAGLINVNGQSVSLSSGAEITASTSGAGNGGNIQITAKSLTINGQAPSTGGADIPTGIQAVTSSASSPAPGGTIQITADSVALDHMGTISTTSFGPGSGGNIDVTAGNLDLANNSSIRAASEGTGHAGTISLRAEQNISLKSDSAVSTSAPLSSGGDIKLNAGSKITLVDSQVSAQAGLNGGNIELTAPNQIYLLRSTLTGEADATGSGFGNGGNLTIDPSFLILDHSKLISKSSLGNGGNISILSDYFLQSESVIDATAPFGLPGTVTVTAPNLDLSASLIALPSNLLDVETQLRPDCGVRLSGNVSSFIVLGSGGLPVEPGGFVPASTPAGANEQR